MAELIHRQHRLPDPRLLQRDEEEFRRVARADLVGDRAGLGHAPRQDLVAEPEAGVPKAGLQVRLAREQLEEEILVFRLRAVVVLQVQVELGVEAQVQARDEELRVLHLHR